MKKTFCSFLFLISISIGMSQEHFPVEALGKKETNSYVLRNVNVQVDSKTTLFNVDILIEGDRIKQVGPNLTAPATAVEIQYDGKWVYPALIELHTDLGLEFRNPSQQKKKHGPHPKRDRKGPYSWNDAIKPTVNAYEHLNPDSSDLKKYYLKGIGFALSHIPDGIIRGTACLFSLETEKEPNQIILHPEAALFLSFDKGSSKQDYPSSEMGAIALLRQTFYDQRWYQNTSPQIYDADLEALTTLLNKKIPIFFVGKNKFQLLRAHKIAKEFQQNWILVGNGDEYQALSSFEKYKPPLVIPLAFPKPYKIQSPLDFELASYRNLKHWDLAPSNPYFLWKVGIPFAFSFQGLNDFSELNKKLRLVHERGLPISVIKKALFEIPASYLNMNQYLGKVQPNAYASLIILSDSLLSANPILLELWTRGQRHVLNSYFLFHHQYRLSAQDTSLLLKVQGTPPEPKIEIFMDTIKMKVTPTFQDFHWIFTFHAPNDSLNHFLHLYWETSSYDKGYGYLLTPTGKQLRLQVQLDSLLPTPEDTNQFHYDVRGIEEIPRPFSPYGFYQLPETKAFLITNATVWTNTSKGILEGYDVYLAEGKIMGIGKNLKERIRLSKEVEIIDGTGLHLTPGIIDEHSHIAISGGVNEGTQNSSAEVRISDVINPEDVNLYRQLAGGVVAAQLLHGSANPIGGQSAIIKFRWGEDAEGLLIQEAPPFIKFALGENVKQSNWGDSYRTRYPQTRMGVEQVYYDAFLRAKRYLHQKKQKKPYRIDLELEALSEILQGIRFITCHSYVQSEINMLMHVADSLGFKVNTFTHGLEAYKVADLIRKHGAGVSTFSDWWAYKFEVYEAIPYNAAICHKKGITVAINSDDAEMGRRLNQEAAKSIKYGNLSPQDALKLVTLNPAKLLHLEKWMGTIEVGKSADIVLWDQNPLSIYAKVEKTFVEGRLLYDKNRDLLLRKRIRHEKMQIIQRMNQAIEKGEKSQPLLPPNQIISYHCEP